MAKDRRSEPERHTMKGWGSRMGTPDTQLTMEEGRFVAQMAAADRLYDIGIILLDLQTRLQRMETWLENNLPGYAPPQEAPADGPPPTASTPILLQPRSRTNGSSLSPEPYYRGPTRRT